MTTQSRKQAIQVWRAFFNNYQDLSTGMLYEVGKGPQAYLNIAADFEVINKMHYDMLLPEIEAMQAKCDDYEKVLFMIELNRGPNAAQINSNNYYIAREVLAKHKK